MFFPKKVECTVKEMQLHSILFIEFSIALKFELFMYQNKKLLEIIIYLKKLYLSVLLKTSLNSLSIYQLRSKSVI